MRKPVLVDGGFGYPLGVTAAVAVTLVAVAAHGTAHPAWVLAALAVTVAAVAAVTTLPAASAATAVAWSLQSGFVLGRYGGLVFTPASLTAAAVLGVVTVAAYATALAVRHLRMATVRVPLPRQPVAAPMITVRDL